MLKKYHEYKDFLSTLNEGDLVSHSHIPFKYTLLLKAIRFLINIGVRIHNIHGEIITENHIRKAYEELLTRRLYYIKKITPTKVITFDSYWNTSFSLAKFYLLKPVLVSRCWNKGTRVVLYNTNVSMGGYCLDGASATIQGFNHLRSLQVRQRAYDVDFDPNENIVGSGVIVEENLRLSRMVFK